MARSAFLDAALEPGTDNRSLQESYPLEFGRQLFDAAASVRKEFFTVPHGGHNDPQTGAYYEKLAQFLDKVE